MSGTIAESNLRTYTFPGSFDEDDDRESDDDAEDTQVSFDRCSRV